MPFPADLTLVTVNMQFDQPVAGGAYGTVTFTSRVALQGPSAGSIVPPFGRVATLDLSGAATIQLPATNDPDWTPVDWTYEITARVNGAIIRGTLQLDHATPSVQLTDLLQVNGAGLPGVTYATLPQFNELEEQLADLGTNVTKFGVVGDGVTDNTAAIAAAENSVKATGGKLWWPDGTYLTGPQFIDSNVIWEGESRYGTVIKLLPGSNADLLRTRDFDTLVGTNGVNGNLGCRGHGLRNLTLDANRTQQTARARCYASYGWNHTVDAVNFINGRGGGVTSVWTTSDTTNDHMEAMWRNFKVWNYGGVKGGAIGLDWSGPHDSMLADYVIATLDSTIRPYHAMYGATPINVGTSPTATIPGSGTFTFTTTEAAPVDLFPETGGWFIVPHDVGTGNFSVITYTSASTVGSVTTFVGCSGGAGRVVGTSAANVGIINPAIGLLINGTQKGEFGLVQSQGHIWGRSHIGMTPKMLTTPYNDIPIFSTGVHVEGAFLANVIMSNKSTFTGGSVYGTFAQAGNDYEVGFVLSLPWRGAESIRVSTIVYNVGKTGGPQTCAPIINVNSDVYDLDVQGTTNTAEFFRTANTYKNRSSVKVSCQNNTALSLHWFAARNPIPVFWGGFDVASGGFTDNGPKFNACRNVPPLNSVAGKTGDLMFSRDGDGATPPKFIFRATAITNGLVSTWTAVDDSIPRVNGVVTDSQTMWRKANDSSAFRIRATGEKVDLDYIDEVIFGRFTEAAFGGSGEQRLRLHGAGTVLAKLTEFGTGVYGGDQYVDANDSKAAFGGKNDAVPMVICGYLAGTGAPASGAWDAGQFVVRDDGWWRCTASGTPGTWAKAA